MRGIDEVWGNCLPTSRARESLARQVADGVADDIHPPARRDHQNAFAVLSRADFQRRAQQAVGEFAHALPSRLTTRGGVL